MSTTPHKIHVNLDASRRKKLEVLRTCLTLQHPDAGFASFVDAIGFLLDNAPLEEMLNFIQAHQKLERRMENEPDRTQLVRRIAESPGDNRPTKPLVAKRGRKKVKHGNS
jgi:predicted house-cleaning noncanonical NTP pyrophosphatase (MazG superfamily)